MASAVLSAIGSAISTGIAYSSWTAAAWAFGTTPVLSEASTQRPEVLE